MGPEKPLPHNDSFENADSYVESLLDFVSASDILQTLCGGVHVLDIFTRSPGLYTTALPLEWREWFALHNIEDILDLLLRDDLKSLLPNSESGSPSLKWRNGPSPPQSLLCYIDCIRRHSLSRDRHQDNATSSDTPIPKNITVGMKTKKVHEVSHFAKYVSSLCDDIEKSRGEPVSRILDFGSGQNYLGRTLASKPYHRRIIAIESESHNVSGAKAKDVYAKVSHKKNNQCNKKLYRGQLEYTYSGHSAERNGKLLINGENETIEARDGHQNIDYISHKITSGNLDVVCQVESQQISNETDSNKNSYMVISLHSCGNLLHHGLRTIELNKSVGAVALVGCCYNLMTEKLGPALDANENLRFRHPRLEKESNARDEHGFPLSKRLELYRSSKKSCSFNDQRESRGIRLNVTARMLAVQAPSNWGKDDSEDSFRRHFFRALLQRVFLDHHVVGQIGGSEANDNYKNGKPIPPMSNVDETAWSEPLTIGKLPKKSYQSFPQYASDAIAKSLRVASRLSESDSALPPPLLPPSTLSSPIASAVSASSATTLRDRLESATKIPLETFEAYLREYSPRKHEIEVLWSLMAFSAEVIEAVIVVDRWLYLCELENVGPPRAWVEPVWQYRTSPRNLVVVGVKK